MLRGIKRIELVACVSITLCNVISVGQEIFQPYSATASSEHSSPYDIGNAIDGSGLPVGFGPSDPHANYVVNNHWTTAANQVPGVAAIFCFSENVTINTFYMWNHRSNGIASNQYYEVTSFDLIVRDGAGNELLILEDQIAMGETAVAQTYAFPEQTGVRSVLFIINENQGFLQGTNPNFTGLAEVAFGGIGPTGPLLGDLNCDGVISVSDIGAFVLALTNPSGYAVQFPNCDINAADMNEDFQVSVSDIGLFVQALSGCPLPEIP